MLSALIPPGLSESLPLLDLTAGALLGLAVLLILTGRLIPKSVHQERVSDLIKENEFLREALRERDVLTRELMVTAEVTNGVMRALDPKAPTVHVGESAGGVP